MDNQTLVATFQDYSAAQNAARELETVGVPRDAIHIDSNRKTTGAGSTERRTEEEHGGFMGWWDRMFGSHHDEDRTYYEGSLASGSAILRANVPQNLIDTAIDTMNHNGAIDIDRGRGTGGTGYAEQTRGSKPIKVVEEDLQVGKRPVQRGGVRVYSHVVNEPVEEQVRLRHERAKVERRPVDRDARPEEVNALRDQTIEVTEMTEEPVVSKKARVKEEVVVGKEATERTETIRDNVRRTEVEVENLNEPNRGPRETRPATGMSPNPPTRDVKSGFGTTPGAGTLAGEGTTRYRDEDFTPEYRKNFEQTYGSDTGFDTMRPAYEYGRRTAEDARFHGRSWDDAERDIRTDYERNNPGSSWDRAKSAVRYGWDRFSGRR